MAGAAKAEARANETVQLTGMERHREERFREMFEGAAIGIATYTLDGHILETNAALARMLGYSCEELSSLHARDVHPADFQPDETLLAELRRGERHSFKQERRYRHKDGSYIWGQLTVSAVHDAGADAAFLIVMLEDATECRRAAEKSHQAEKMEVIGRLAGGIAHDFNNLLTGVLLYCDLLSAGIEPGSHLLRHVEEIRFAGEQGAALTQQLLAIARKQVPQPRPILLNDVVSASENLLRRLIGEQIDLVTVLAPNLPTVLADQAQLRQVLLNLVLNARDAMPHGGGITVSTQPSDRLIGDQAAVSLLVEDTGCGMDEHTRARLFKPFFTTKPPGHGTGLGLATVQHIVSESKGTITVKSETGQGTQIEVLLPVIGAVPAAGVSAERSRTGETILLVDDHSSARNSIQRVLHHAGYRVLQASSGRRALKLFSESPQGVDLLIADWMMPGMNGRELAEKLRQQKPELKVLLISGYQDLQDSSSAASVELIRKPFAGPVLIERIRKVLDGKGDSKW
jgi:two-component system, cell cycle sensor histidine kinase and response regulator CckA